MYMNNDISNLLNMQGCDPDKEEGQRTANQNTKELIEAGTALGVNRLYNKYGDAYKETVEMSLYLWAWRCIGTDIIPEFDKVYPDFDSIYERMKNEGWTEEEIDKVKNLPSSFVTQVKQGMETVITEGDGFVDGKYVKPYDYLEWILDKTKPAPLKAVTFWNNYTETNDWYITVGGYGELGKREDLENKTVEEVKARIAELIEEWLGDPLISQDVEPVDFDQYGGVIMNKSMKDADDEDTFMVTNYNGDSFAVDGIDKAKETATQFRKERAGFELSYFVYRKITEPDGYFAWREENIADYL